MSQHAAIFKENTLKNIIYSYKYYLAFINDKSKNYLKNSNDKNFSDIIQILKKMYYNQIVFPKKIRKEKNFKHFKNAFLEINKIDKKLEVHDIINEKFSKDKNTISNQESIKNFETSLKVIEQNQVAKSNKVLFDLHYIKISSFNEKFIDGIVSKKIRKILEIIYKLTRKIEKQINIIASNNINNETIILKKIIKLQKSLEKNAIADICKQAKDINKNTQKESIV